MCPSPGKPRSTIDERLRSLVVPYEEWEILYRQRLQIERDLRRATPPASVMQVVGRAVESLVGSQRG